jgi:hypothetical protein
MILVKKKRNTCVHRENKFRYPKSSIVIVAEQVKGTAQQNRTIDPLLAAVNKK